MWDRQLPGLTARWRVVRFDLPWTRRRPRGARLLRRRAHRPAPRHPRRTRRPALRLRGHGPRRSRRRRPRAARSAPARRPHPDRGLTPRFGTADEYRQRAVRRPRGRPRTLSPPARPSGGSPRASPPPSRAIADWAVQMVRTTDPGCYIAACEAPRRVRRPCRPRQDRRAHAGPRRLRGPGRPGPAEARTLVAGASPTPGSPWCRAPRTSPPSSSPPPSPTCSSGASPAPCRTPLAALLAAAAPRAALHPLARTRTGRPGAAASPPCPCIEADPYEAGLRTRREVLGDAYVDRPPRRRRRLRPGLQDLATRYAWGGVDPRRARPAHPQLRHPRRAGRPRHTDELAAHTRAALRNGLTPAEIREVLLHTAVYCGLPAANAAFRVAHQVIKEETAPRP